MICLTGDVHHSSLNTADQSVCRGTEMNAAYDMAGIAAKHGIKLTLFFTGLCARESPRLLNEFSKMENIEIGGHNYYAFKFRKLFGIYGRLTGLKNGPAFYQALEVRRTIQALRTVGPAEVLSWRDHSYRHDRNTRKILARYGIRYLSDTLSGDGGQPKSNGGVIDVPINNIPDHDYVYHGKRQPGTFDETHLLRSVFRTGAMFKSEWLNRIKRESTEIDSNGGISVILAHPACMKIIDNFETYDNLCSFLSKFMTINVNEICISKS